MAVNPLRMTIVTPNRHPSLSHKTVTKLILRQEARPWDHDGVPVTLLAPVSFTNTVMVFSSRLWKMLNYGILPLEHFQSFNFDPRKPNTPRISSYINHITNNTSNSHNLHIHIINHPLNPYYVRQNHKYIFININSKSCKLIHANFNN